MNTTNKLPYFCLGDLDGFFGLFVDNLLQLMLIMVLCNTVCGLPTEFITHQILPGAALSILAGNLFYAWQARRLAKLTGRQDVTALPYGINTASLMAFIFLVMGPVYQETKNPLLTWQVGLFASLVSAVVELIGVFFGDWLRKNTPRAALLSSLAGIAITFIAMSFIFEIFASPLLALFPMLIILIAYTTKMRFWGGLPGGFIALLVGTFIAWLSRWLGFNLFQPSAEIYSFGLHPPFPVPADLFSFIFSAHGWKYMAVIFPMSLFNIIGSLQNLESAQAAGDNYPTKPSLFANGICGFIAALFGSPFPTTIYIGHPAWKAMGARSGYSVLNGVVIALLCFLGGITFLLQWIPLEATLGILLWIGIVITSQAFQEVPKAHNLAVAVGLIPALAAWGLLLIETTLRKAGTTLFATATQFGHELYIYGIIALSQGFLLSSILLAAFMVYLIEKDFFKAGCWALAAATLSFFGFIHAFNLSEAGVQNSIGFGTAPDFAFVYALTAFCLFLLDLKQRKLSEGFSYESNSHQVTGWSGTTGISGLSDSAPPKS